MIGRPRRIGAAAGAHPAGAPHPGHRPPRAFYLRPPKHNRNGAHNKLIFSNKRLTGGAVKRFERLIINSSLGSCKRSRINLRAAVRCATARCGSGGKFVLESCTRRIKHQFRRKGSIVFSTPRLVSARAGGGGGARAAGPRPRLPLQSAHPECRCIFMSREVKAPNSIPCYFRDTARRGGAGGAGGGVSFAFNCPRDIGVH
ncbi:hypothetical protein EVAR_49893_1 [Eumeta japonica]|uniref:Uncharacterized protein n=1 Tax=Eumeta variegata TaxID=151549 RepID=A0A4C1Y058_EUMVA|nr:hypothetical protein EVAR_49893_1 [Eumeta japonica]